MLLHPTQVKLLENKTTYNLILNCVVVFKIMARGDLRKKRSEVAFVVGDFMVVLPPGFKEWLEVRLGKGKGGGLPGGEEPELSSIIELDPLMTPRRRLDPG